MSKTPSEVKILVTKVCFSRFLKNSYKLAVRHSVHKILPLRRAPDRPRTRHQQRNESSKVMWNVTKPTSGIRFISLHIRAMFRHGVPKGFERPAVHINMSAV